MKKLPHQTRRWLFDGIGTGTHKQRFNLILAGESFTFSERDFIRNSLRNLSKLIDPEDFGTIIKTEKFSDGTNFQSAERLGIFFLVHGKFLIFLAAGEFQPGREMVILESVWESQRPMANNPDEIKRVKVPVKYYKFGNRPVIAEEYESGVKFYPFQWQTGQFSEDPDFIGSLTNDINDGIVLGKDQFDQFIIEIKRKRGLS